MMQDLLILAAIFVPLVAVFAIKEVAAFRLPKEHVLNRVLNAPHTTSRSDSPWSSGGDGGGGCGGD